MTDRYRLASWALIIASLVFLAVSIYYGGGLLLIVGAVATIILLRSISQQAPREEEQPEAKREAAATEKEVLLPPESEGIESVAAQKAATQQKREVTAAYEAYVAARLREISQKGEPRKTYLPCTPAVQALVEEAIKLVERGNSLEALVLLEAQKLLEGKFRERERERACPAV